MSTFDHLPPAGKKQARIPRFGRLIGAMNDEQLARLDSNSAVYWEVLTYVSLRGSETTGLLDSGLRSEGAYRLGWHHNEKLGRENRPMEIRHWQVRLALGFISAVAFQMMCGTDEEGNPSPMDRVKPDDVQSFEKAVKASMVASGVYTDQDGDPIGKHLWSKDWECIQCLNSGLDYNVFSDTETEILFTDINVRDFLAAHWAVRWASPDEQQLTQDWLPRFGNDNSDYAEFWNRVVEIRELPCSPKQNLTPYELEKWESLLAPVFDCGLQRVPDVPIRSTELVYRTWSRMEHHSSMTEFKRQFPRLLVESETAQRLLFTEDGSSQFITLADPNDPRDEWETFVKSDDGELVAEFLMGSPEDDINAFSDEKPQHSVRLTSSFAMHRYCVTNAQFELFDPCRSSEREFADRIASDQLDEHPAVNLSWYDAWCFTRWIDSDGKRLILEMPTEAQWEYACRCGRSTAYTWGDGSDGNQINETNAWYGWFPDQRSEKERTIAVDGINDDPEKPIPANPWGLHQMHGNVWEWCGDWFDAKFYESELSIVVDPTGPDTGSSRVLRGGSWFDYGRGLRSAFRDRLRPSLRYGLYGFRLAAVPLSSASKVEQAEAKARQAE